MPATYELATPATESLLHTVREQHHAKRGLDAVRFGVLMAFGPVDKYGFKTGPAISGHAGAPAAAQVKSVPLRDRLTKGYDVEMIIDGDEWPKLSEPQKIAILDHELTHVCLGKGTDDLGRPKIKMRDEDFIAWGFWEVIQRHGTAAMEHRALTLLAEKHGQLLLGLDPMTESKIPGVEGIPVDMPHETSVTVGPESLKKVGELGKVLREAGATMAVSVNGGPEKDMTMSQLGQEISRNMADKRRRK